VAENRCLRDVKVAFKPFACHTHCGLSNSWISFSRSLKHPREQIEFRMSVSTTEIDGITCVCTTSIMGSSSSSSLLPPAVTHGCLLISDSWNWRERLLTWRVNVWIIGGENEKVSIFGEFTGEVQGQGKVKTLTRFNQKHRKTWLSQTDVTG
jgi:hypothetical protein